MKHALLVLSVVVGCSKQEPTIVARLEQKDAVVERMPRVQAAWQPATIGDGFIIGSAVRTGENAHAKLRVGKSGKLDVKPNAVVYFGRDPGRSRDDVKVETGTVELEAGDDMLGLGEAVLDPHGKAEVSSGPQGTTIVVRVGRVVLEDNVVAAGQSITLSPAGAVAQVKPDAGVAPVAKKGLSVAITGKPARMTTKAGEAELAVGTHDDVEPGAGIVTPDGSTAEVIREGARGATSGAADVRVGDGSSLVAITTGTVALDAQTADAVAKIPGGTVTTKTGGAAGVSVDKTGAATIDAQRGDTVVETAQGTESLAAGDSITVTSDGKVERAAPPPKRTVATIAAGESPVIHDAAAPTPVRIGFGTTCTGPGTVEVAKDRSFKRVIARAGGHDAANVLVPVGSFFYRVRCPGKGASGTIRIAKDSGRAPLPKAAAKTLVEMDGREYTILYQNLLPELTLSWRTAPKKAGYTFVIKPQSGAEKRFTSPTPKITLRPGELREGTYTAWVEPDGGRKSDAGKLSIEFDNAASSAQIEDVEEQSGNLHVKGMVIEGSTVTANGAAIELDRHRRFSADLAPGADQDGAAIRILNTKGGIHYYVMRVAPR